MEKKYLNGWLEVQEIEYIDKIDYYINKLRLENLKCLMRVYDNSYDFAWRVGKPQFETLTNIQNNCNSLLLYARALRDKLNEL